MPAAGAALHAGPRLRHGSTSPPNRCAPADLLWARLALAASAVRRAPRRAAQTSGRVAYLNCNLWFGVKAGGSVGHISGVANALMDAGYDLTLFTAGDRLLVDERAALVPLPAPRMLAMPLETSQYRFGRRCFASSAALCGKHRRRFIYQRLSLGNFAGVTLSPTLRACRWCWSTTARKPGSPRTGAGPCDFTTRPRWRRTVNIRHAHLIVTVSDVLREELLGAASRPKRIVTYPNCIDPKTFDPARFPPETMRARAAKSASRRTM